jgi:tetratricopeptide (TPR) repeat protein
MFALVGLSLSAVFRGRWEESVGWTDQTHEGGVVAGDDGAAAFGSAFASFAALSRGDIDTAIALADRALTEAPTVYFQGWALTFRAAAMCQTDEIEAGIAALSEALDLLARSRHASGYMVLAQLLAGAWLLAGRPDRARALAAPLEVWATTAGVPFVKAGAASLVGEADLAEGRPTAAADWFASAAAGFAAIGAENGRAQALSGHGRALAALGDVETARALLEDALTTFEYLGTLGEPDRIRAALSRL